MYYFFSLFSAVGSYVCAKRSSFAQPYTLRTPISVQNNNIYVTHSTTLHVTAIVIAAEMRANCKAQPLTSITWRRIRSRSGMISALIYPFVSSPSVSVCLFVCVPLVFVHLRSYQPHLPQPTHNHPETSSSFKRPGCACAGCASFATDAVVVVASVASVVVVVVIERIVRQTFPLGTIQTHTHTHTFEILARSTFIHSTRPKILR